MHTVVHKVSKITSKNQTTVPKVVRDALNLEPGGEVEFLIKGDVVRVINPNNRDPVLRSFLSLIGNDIAKAHNVNVLSEALAEKLQNALQQDVNLEEPLEGEVSL
jgi:antitoxin PrlF